MVTKKEQRLLKNLKDKTENILLIMSTVEFKNGSINIISHEVRNEFPVDVSGTGSRVSSGDDVNLALAQKCIS